MQISLAMKQKLIKMRLFHGQKARQLKLPTRQLPIVSAKLLKQKEKLARFTQVLSAYEAHPNITLKEVLS